MKKTVLILAVSILMTAGSVYAQGDLHVMGKLGVGTDTPAKDLDVYGGAYIHNENVKRVLSVNSSLDQDFGWAGGDFTIAANYGASLTGTSTGHATAMSAVAGLMSTGLTTGNIISASFVSQIGRADDPSPGTETTASEVAGFHSVINRRYNNARIYNITNAYGVHTALQEGATYGAPVNITNYYHHFSDDPGTLTTIIIDRLAGTWIEKQTAGANNYGIVLAGDGAGADIVFGPNQEARIYSEGGYLKAQDVRGNVTQFSPHDPETGEWIYYSENVKTGEVVRVDMERLVKDMEKITGNTYMVKTMKKTK